MKPDAVLFDWDVTMVDSVGAIHGALDETFDKFGGERWTRDDVAEWLRRSMRVSFKDLFNDKAGEAATHFYGRYRDNHLSSVTLMPGAVETLEMLEEAGVYLGVVSSKKGDLVRAEAQVRGSEARFSRLVGASDAKADKPSPEAIELALSGSEPAAGEGVWYVGDCGIDVVCARNAGCVSVIIGASPAYVGEKTHTPDQHFVDHSAFQTFVRGAGFTI